MKLKLLILVFSFFTINFVFSQNIGLYNQFVGRVDFTMIGNTLNIQENGATTDCIITTSSSANLNLNTNDTIESAYLYWSGSGTGDFEVTLNNQLINAERTFNLDTAQLTYFSAFANITSQVQNIGNGNYTLADLDLTNVIDNYCGNATNFGGWAIIIVYSNNSLPINQINLYDGLESISAQNPAITIQLNNLDVIDNTNAKVGFLAWEGDSGIAVNESLRINGNLISNPPLNPSTNVFNGTNSFTGANDLYNMDLDFYNIENYINVGDTSATIQLTSGQDFVMLNAVVTKLNVQLPDATVAINSFQLLNCNDREVEIDFTIFNIGEGILPVNTPISIYGNDTFITTVFTQNEILTNQSENFIEIINIPSNVPDIFTLKIVVDDDGLGNSTVFETNELNNEDKTAIVLYEVPIANQIPNIAFCDDNPDTTDGINSFDTSEIETAILGGINAQLNMNVFYFAEDGTVLPSPLPNPFMSGTQTITVLVENPLNTTCNATTTINFIVVEYPIANPVTINSQCDDDQDGFTYFDTSQIENNVLQGQTDVTLTYFNEDGTALPSPLPNPFLTQSQTITIVATSSIANDLNGICSNETTLEFVVDKLPFIVQEVIIDPLCDDVPNDLDGLSNFDTSTIESTILGNSQSTMEVFYFAENGDLLPSPLPNPFATATQTITVVVENPINRDCKAIATIDFEVILLPDFEVFDDTICLNFLPTPLIVTIENAQDNYDYEWRNANNEVIGTNSDQVAIFEGGTCSVTATTQDNLACATTKIFTITEVIVEINQPKNLLECDEGFNTAVFNLEETINQITQDFDLEITFFTSENDLIANTNSITFTSQYTNTSDPQTIYVRVENLITQCYEITTFLLETEDCLPVIPDAFTPNNDNLNETFTINGLHDVFLDFEIYIYNRWGNLVYKGNNNKQDWDGTYKGKELPVGTYFYRLYFNDEENLYTPVRGWIYLNR